MKVLIRAAFETGRQTYGSPRITDELRKQGVGVSRKRVARLMKEMKLVAKPPPRTYRTTHSAHSMPVAENLLSRNFQTGSPNEVWVTDITYLPIVGGVLYLSVILDLFSRKVVGWSVAGHMRTELCLSSLNQAISLRNPPRGLIHHSDQGSQYASRVYQAALKSRGLLCSMSRKGDCWDNAVAESFFSTLKSDLVRRRSWRSLPEG